jgi:streptogramin lyase
MQNTSEIEAVWPRQPLVVPTLIGKWHPNTLVRFDPNTKSFSSTPIPSGGGVVRNIAATKDGKLYLACSGVNKVAIVTVH